MGESRRRALMGRPPGLEGTNGHTKIAELKVRVVANIKLESVPADGALMMMLGDRVPEIAVAMTPADARKLATALLEHATQLEQASRRIILPGEDLTL